MRDTCSAYAMFLMGSEGRKSKVMVTTSERAFYTGKRANAMVLWWKCSESEGG